MSSDCFAKIITIYDNCFSCQKSPSRTPAARRGSFSFSWLRPGPPYGIIYAAKHTLEGEQPHDFFQRILFVCVFAVRSDRILPFALPHGQECVFNPREPVFLCLGRALVCVGDAAFHRHQLVHRPAHRRGGAQKGLASGGPGVRPGPARGLQVPGFFDGKRELDLSPFVAGAADRFAHWHIVFHVPGHFLHRRRVPRRWPGAEESDERVPVHIVLSAADRWAHRALPNV